MSGEGEQREEDRAERPSQASAPSADADRTRPGDDRGDPPAVPPAERELKLVSTPQFDSQSSDPSSAKMGADDGDAISASEAPNLDSPGRQDSGDESSSRSLPIWVFALLVVVFAVALGWQQRVAGGLEREIAALEAELSVTTARLGAHRARLEEIRQGVGELSSHLEGLRVLVDADPEDSVAAGDNRLQAAPGEPQAAPFEIPARLPH